ncbi:C40 family peptidase [Streptacidiphilus monticola]
MGARCSALRGAARRRLARGAPGRDRRVGRSRHRHQRRRADQCRADAQAGPRPAAHAVPAGRAGDSEVRRPRGPADPGAEQRRTARHQARRGPGAGGHRDRSGRPARRRPVRRGPRGPDQAGRAALRPRSPPGAARRRVARPGVPLAGGLRAPARAGPGRPGRRARGRTGGAAAGQRVGRGRGQAARGGQQAAGPGRGAGHRSDGAQREELSLLEQKEANAAQAALLASGLLGKGDLRPSAAGAKAVAYAFAQLGKPYVWGAEGPDSFDCSGLTSQAWLHAGVPIPRTSEMQWADLTRVPLNALRPAT